MMAKRSLLMFVRVVGLLALGLVLYAWLNPSSLDERTSRPGIGSTAQAEKVVTDGREPVTRNKGAGETGTSALHEADSVSALQKVSSAQAKVARWVGARYRVSPDAIAELVAEADRLSRSYRLSPNLLIAVMAIESNFNPYIQSESGAQGLMQVMPKIHSKRYEKFGGKASFLDPMVSLRVGAEILRDCIKLKGGSEEEGLRFYSGGGPASDEYIAKVRAEQRRLNLVSRGVQVASD